MTELCAQPIDRRLLPFHDAHQLFELCACPQRSHPRGDSRSEQDDRNQEPEKQEVHRPSGDMRLMRGKRSHLTSLAPGDLIVLPAVQDRGDSPRVVIGVAGGSGSGKTTVVGRIIESIGDEQVTVLEHDRYYRDRGELRLEERATLNYDHPDSLETDLLVRHLHELRAGRPVEVPTYDFARHARQPTTATALPRRAIIVEGILIFADAALRSLMDVKVFVDADDDTRFIRRLQRDIAERGRTLPSVIEQYLGTVKPMHLEFVEPSKRYADIIVPVGGHNAVAIDMLLTLIRSLTSR